MLRAHLIWAGKRWPEVAGRLKPHLEAPDLALVEQPPQGVADTILFSQLVRIDRAIAAAAGGDKDEVFRALGAHSAEINLAGLYGHFDPEAPHRLFNSMAFLHRTFQTFGESRYERLGERSGRIRLDQYEEYSPVFCSSGAGYYAQALRMMQVPGPVSVREVTCQCAGDAACVFDLSW